MFAVLGMVQNQIKIQGNVAEILARAPKAVESYHPGHWEFLCQLERDAQGALKSRSVEAAVSFLANVAFLKMP